MHLFRKTFDILRLLLSIFYNNKGKRPFAEKEPAWTTTYVVEPRLGGTKSKISPVAQTVQAFHTLIRFPCLRIIWKNLKFFMAQGSS